MRHRLQLAAAATLIALGLAAQAHAGLLISEYVEGSSYNKAVELYNDSNQTVDLSGYSLDIYFNGNSSAGAQIALLGQIPAHQTFVLADSNADPAVTGSADQLYSGSLFNGDDAVVLSHNGQTVDAIGQIGVDPGSEWGTGTTTTKDHSLRRKADHLTGRSDASTSFDPATDFDGFAQDSFADLGQFSPASQPPGGGSVSCNDSATPIHTVQGSGATTPLDGQTVTVNAIVTASFQDTGLKGFFLQTPDSEIDNDPATSEGLFVYAATPQVAVGDRIAVRGTAGEYSGQTQLSQVDGIAVCSSGNSVTPMQPSLPWASADAPEAYEGMRVNLPQTLTVTENYNLGRYGELTLSSGGRIYVPTSQVAPGAPAQARAAADALRTLVLDDGQTVQNPDPVIYPAPELSALKTVRSGDTVTGLSGVMTYAFGAWTVEPVGNVSFTPANPRPQASDLPPDDGLRIASFNVLNYFNGDGQGGGFPTARGADTPEELARQQAKIVAAIVDLNADVLGLMELENDGYGNNSAIRELVDAVNAAAPAGTHYAFVDPGSSQLGGDAIAVGMLYNTKTVIPAGNPATISTTPFDDLNRQPLAQSFTPKHGNGVFTVVVNHFKSKGSCPGDGSADDDQGDGQGCWNPTRTAAAQAIVDWVATDPTGAGTDKALVIGDLNSYAKEDPISTFKNNGYADLIQQNVGPDAYSFVYMGQSGYLDHALASPSLAPAVISAAEWHINADEPHAIDYNEEYKSAGQIDSFYNADPYRASDHDPLVVQLDPAALSESLAPHAGFKLFRFGNWVIGVDHSRPRKGLQLADWEWSFGDGGHATGPVVMHRYAAGGHYSVQMTVRDSAGHGAAHSRDFDL